MHAVRQCRCHVSRQNVSFDCGVFTCACLLHLAMGYVGDMPFTQVKAAQNQMWQWWHGGCGVAAAAYLERLRCTVVISLFTISQG